MSDIRTKILIDGNSIHVNRVQDVEPTLEWAKWRASLPNPRGDRFWEKWTLAPVQVEQLFNRYARGNPEAKMDQEFWTWVDKIIMSDADYAHCRLVNKSNPFFMGYDK